MPADSDARTEERARRAPRPRAMRADAQRNREQILRAAREVFVGQGPDAPLDEIARRAGVGIATLYRRFPERTDLIRGVAVHVFTALGEAAKEAERRHGDPLDALRWFMHEALRLKPGAVMPALIGHLTASEELEEISLATERRVQGLLARAQEAGEVRPGIAFGDVALMVARLSRPLPGPFLAVDEPLAHRQLDIYIDGLRTRPAEADGRPGEAFGGPRIDVGWFEEMKKDVLRDASDPAEGPAPSHRPGE